MIGCKASLIYDQPYISQVLEKSNKIVTLVLQLCSKGQVCPLTSKKTNLVSQLLFLSQICPYIDVMLHNTMT